MTFKLFYIRVSGSLFGLMTEELSFTSAILNTGKIHLFHFVASFSANIYDSERNKIHCEMQTTPNIETKHR